MTHDIHFTAGGHVWAIHWTMATSRRLAAVGVQAYKPADLEHIFALFADSLKLADALWVCVEGKGKTLGVSKEQFEDSLGGDELESGPNALAEAFTRFAPTGVRGAMREAIAEYYRTVRAISDAYIAELNGEAVTPAESAVA